MSFPSRPLLEHHFRRVVAYDMIYKLPIRQAYEMPELDKVTLHVSRSRALSDLRSLLIGRAALTILSGQEATITTVKKSQIIRGNLRMMKGQTLGTKVTLRGRRAYDFLTTFRNEIVPNLSNEYRGAGMDRTGSIGSGTAVAPAALREMHPLFDAFRGFQWTASAKRPKHGRMKVIHEDVAALLFSGLGVPVRGKGAHDAQALRDAADREKEARDMEAASGRAEE
ncbi:unnamed protein product [Pedinophyceae sp. YPF-701]|nr:unnamed protein product [Pedinophyceae sp. YPF-701]